MADVFAGDVDNGIFAWVDVAVAVTFSFFPFTVILSGMLSVFTCSQGLRKVAALFDSILYPPT